MPIHKLTRSIIASLVRDKFSGRKSDGGGLYLECQQGVAYWIFRWKTLGKQRYMGLGPLNTIGVDEARAAALAARQDLHAGRDPIAVRKAARIAAQLEAAKQVSFDDYSQSFIEDHANEWANAASKDQWANSIKTYCSPVFGHVRIADVDTPLIVEALRPIWTTKPIAAMRLRGRLERVLGAAVVAGLRPEGPNPARWKGHLAEILPSRGKKDPKVGHHPALPYAQAVEFMADLRGRQGVAARALEFLILCAVRTGDLRGQQRNEDRAPMRWRDLDLSKREWAIPETKTGLQHFTVPLSPPALAVLAKVKGLDPELVFPSPDKPGEPLSSAAMAATIARMNGDRIANGLAAYVDPKQKGRAVTVHGFRSTFRDWVSECTSFDGDIAEMALSHAVSCETEAAYRRGDLLAKRARLMTAWATYLLGKPASVGGKVVALGASNSRY